MRAFLVGLFIFLPGLIGAMERSQIPRPEQLVHLQVTETSIRSAPWRVLVAINPGEAEAVADFFNRQDPTLECLLSNRGGLFSYCRPQECPVLPGFTPNPGDVIYVYQEPSLDSRLAFAAKHALAPTGRTGQVPEGAAVLYSASPGYYVMIVVPSEPYSCAMHPHQRSAEPGPCPICGMEMIEDQTH